MSNRSIAFIVSSLLVGMAGCTGRPTLVPNEDPALNQKPEVLARQAVKKFPYPAELPVSPNPLPIRAELGYWANEMSLLNFGDTDIDNVDIWVNRLYVVSLPKLESKKVKKIPFEVLYDSLGKHFPRNGTRIESLEIRIDDVMHKVPTQLGQ
jgi:hypothetical protein